MSFNANDLPRGGNGKQTEPLDAGSYPARVVGVAIVGEHIQIYKGEEKPPKKLMYMFYELLDEFLKDEEGNELLDKPRWLNENFPFHRLEAEKAKSTARYLSLDPAKKYGGNFSKLLELPCMLTVVQDPGKDGRVYNNVDGVSSMRPKEADKAPELVNPSFLFDFDAPTKEAWDRLPPWVQEKAKQAIDFPGSRLDALINEGAVAGPVEAPVANDEKDW